MKTKISDKVLIIIVPEERIKEDFGLKQDIIWDKVPENLVVGFFARNYKHFGQLSYIYPKAKILIPEEWNSAKIGFEVKLSGTQGKKIDIVLQCDKTYFIIEAKSRGQVQWAKDEVTQYAKLFESVHPDSLSIRRVVVTSRKGDMSWIKARLE